MHLDEGKQKFIQAWGKYGSSWGINRTMAQIHALLLVSDKALSTDDLMEQLGISRGNANMNVRALMQWGLVHKEFISGERKEFFAAEKDAWLMAKNILEQRRKREIAPMLALLDDLKEVEGDDHSAEDFKEKMKELHKLTSRTNKALARLGKYGDSKIVNTISKMLK